MKFKLLLVAVTLLLGAVVFADNETDQPWFCAKQKCFIPGVYIDDVLHILVATETGPGGEPGRWLGTGDGFCNRYNYGNYAIDTEVMPAVKSNLPLATIDLDGKNVRPVLGSERQKYFVFKFLTCGRAKK